MNENKRFMVDDAGTLIDMVTRDTFDIVEEVVDILNNYEYTCVRYEKIISELKNGTYKEDLPITQNALITNADFVFDDIGGQNGQQFRLELELKTTYGGVNVSFNPLRLPQLLQQLGLTKFSELQGTYIQITNTNFGEEVKGIKSIMAKENEEWFETENNIYFGSEFFKGYDKED